MLAGLPDIQLRLQERNRKRHAVAADRLRERHDVGADARALEGEEPARARAAHLHVVDDHQDVVLVAERADALQPLGRQHVDAAVRLRRFENDRRRLLYAGVVVRNQALHIVDSVERREHVRRRDVRDVVQRHARAGTGIRVGRQRDGAERHAVERAHQRKDVRALLNLARELQRRFDRVRARRADKLDLIIEAAGPDDLIFKIFDERTLRRGVHIHRVQDAVLLEVVDDALLDVRVVVPVVQRTGSAEKVDVLFPVLVVEEGPLGGGEYRGEVAAVGAHLGFVRFKGFRVCVHGLPSFLPCALA